VVAAVWAPHHHKLLLLLLLLLTSPTLVGAAIGLHLLGGLYLLLLL
jgi:hypothetical protein